MKRNMIVSTLVLIMLSTSGINAYGVDVEKRSIPATKIEEALKIDRPVKIISPKQDVIVRDSVLISVQLQDNVSVALSVYKEVPTTEEGEENFSIIVGPEEIEQGESLKFYSKELKDLSQGNYKIVFNVKDEDGKEEEDVVKYFTVKSEKEEIIKTIEAIPKADMTSVLEDVIKK
ncbi:hypothetical protein [Anaeromicrobium sediminis]|uniref:Uncharacterized protein n=1 Tax=Anaeromicrobium sediminis TaxID=1478221 RepID=A0A267MN43_9FIRM|nr:hypothetical protein [Anaeromicrobium sediminis]PAB60170.1 hypothetical protein CCE28_07310 [Anaeromicrobium sediminis]